MRRVRAEPRGVARPRVPRSAVVVRTVAAWIALGLVAGTGVAVAQTSDPPPIVVGLDADMSSVNDAVGLEIQRGAELAIEEINAAGGVLGRPLVLDVRDHRRNPARGEANVRAFAENPDLVAVLGGKQTPVILAELPTIHELGLPYLIPWAAGTILIDNGFDPNYVFRVSVRDELAGGVLVRHGLARGFRSFGLLLEQTGWGRSNEVALRDALAEAGLAPARIEWFNWGQDAFSSAIDRLVADGADVVVFVGNSSEGVPFARAMAARPPGERLPIVSHWGIVGDEFELRAAGAIDALDLVVLQTFSFFDPPFPDRAAAVLGRYVERYLGRDASTARPGDVVAPGAIAHTYDLVGMLAAAIERAGPTERAAVRDALETLPFHAGLLRDYDPPFAPGRHDALDASGFFLARWQGATIVPLDLNADP